MNEKPFEQKAVTVTSDGPLGIGDALRNRRRQRNLTLELAAQETRVQVRFLTAMEEEDWAAFPARVYLEGFLRKYATLLGLDADDMIGRIRGASGAPERTAIAPERAKDVAGAPEEPRSGFQRVLIFLAALAGLFAVVYLVSTSSERTEPAEESVRPARRRAQEPTAPLPGSFAFELRAKDTVWIRAWVDGVVRFEGLMPAGMAKKWFGQTGVRVMAAEVTALDVLVDGQHVESDTRRAGGEFLWDSSQRRTEPAPAVPSPGPAGPESSLKALTDRVRSP